MIKKIFYTSIIFLFFSGCGYAPLINQKTDFTLRINELGGNKKVNYMIKNNLKIYEEKNNKYVLEISNSNIDKTVTSMDTKGNPKTYQITINLLINLRENSVLISESKNFTSIINFNMLSSKFDQKKYEENLIENLTEKISDEIILYIQTL